jgi:FHA domain
MRTLTVTSGPARGETRMINEEILIGREASDLTIPDPGLSRRHVLVRPVNEGVVVQDLGSLNGTFVNGERIDRPVTLTSSARLGLGDSTLEIGIDLVGATVRAPTRVIGREQVTVDRVGAAPARQPSPVYSAPPEGPQRSRRWLKWAVPLAALMLAAALAAGFAFALTGEDQPTQRTLTSNLTTALLKQTATKVTFGGTTSQTPGGNGMVVGQLKLLGDLSKGKPVKLTATMLFRFEGGRINATIKGTAIPKPNKTTDLVGNGKITGGSGEFEGATGSFTFKSGQEPQNPTVGHPKIRGTIRY